MSACRVVFSADRCAGIGLCEATAPDVFEIDDDGKMHVLQTVVDITRRLELEEAATNCPTRSLRIEIVD
ncbi:ferredoxin [Mycolicibacterium holsaticum]|uniref:Ferredoxin n=1 Tax=Mycolicibacterium holsaticum TaxID=152142 RepID=A0A1E3RWF5_9MYCO|nr:ferredoxin [Mycolicibacterium holsaticum]ODQ94256.1 hypothetical protein BHQ17_09835 [Mycolicibacterium holsaticum]